MEDIKEERDIKKEKVTNSPVAQLVRAFGRHPKGHRFESGQDYKSQCRITAITHRWYR